MSGCCGPILTSNGGSGTPMDPIFDVEYVTLCDVAADGTSTGFLRRFIHAQDGTLSSSDDFALDGVTAYTPSGTVGVCGGSDTTTPPVTMQTASTHRQVLDTAGTFDVFATAAGTVESVTVTVIAAGATGPTVTTASGVSPMFGGESVTWSALPDVAAGSDELAGPLSVTTNAGDVVAVSWTERP
ncbi:hypothetical protein [Streptomyces europaeiscabiei]|uniref:hypothetical protein n=1 Tax=Streptomyces europaeiscabiei TaxID=146819 RepID=UPI002E137B8D|nr:hypothetical protein OHB30_33375 [Streptomyces europaeiscabiei]